MDEILSRCGFRCDQCLAFRPNIEADPAVRQALSDGWHTYFGFRIPPEEIVCDGCLAEDSLPIDAACPVRPCAIERNLAHCGLCGEYICARLQDRIIVFEDIAAKVGGQIPEEDRARFIAPYENKVRLERIRQTRA
jgi:hypothetical protein